MSRSRALLALLLAVTWCTAAWHVDLEAVGLLGEHRHHSHDHGHAHHSPAGSHDGHEKVFARDVAKDVVRVVASALVCVEAPPTAVPVPPRILALNEVSRPAQTDPPFARVWQFEQRCAPESAAPPALG